MIREMSLALGARGGRLLGRRIRAIKMWSGTISIRGPSSVLWGDTGVCFFDFSFAFVGLESRRSEPLCLLWNNRNWFFNFLLLSSFSVSFSVEVFEVSTRLETEDRPLGPSESQRYWGAALLFWIEYLNASDSFRTMDIVFAFSTEEDLVGPSTRAGLGPAWDVSFLFCSASRHFYHRIINNHRNDGQVHAIRR